MNLSLNTKIDKIIELSIPVLTEFPKERFTIDYVSIFTQKLSEYETLIYELKTVGKEIINSETGVTFKLSQPIKTKYGPLSFIKIRKKDLKRPQFGAPDFKVKNYSDFKNKYYKNNNDISLISHNSFEMLEIKGIDILIYIPSQPLSTQFKS